MNGSLAFAREINPPNPSRLTAGLPADAGDFYLGGAKMGKHVFMKYKEPTFYVDQSNCHICTSHYVSPKGYPMCKRKGKGMALARALFEEKYGLIKHGLVIRHKCDNKLCINLEHLELGTVRDNARDMVERGRSNRGEERPSHKLTVSQVKQIRRNSLGLSGRALARQYGVCHSTVYDIQNRIMWKHI